MKLKGDSKMNIIKSICVAFSMYSKIPMPRVEWNEKNMKYAMCFFPLVGTAITVQMTGNAEKNEALLRVIRPYGIKNVARTGATGFTRD